MRYARVASLAAYDSSVALWLKAAAGVVECQSI